MQNNTKAKLKEKSLAFFFSEGISLKTWCDAGMIDREVALYNELSKRFKRIYFFTYGEKEDLKFKSYLADNITIVPKKYISRNLLYSLMLPFIHRKILRDVEILKTNQMWGSWSAVLTKLIYRKRLIVRTGYMLSINFAKEKPRNRIKKRIIKLIEMLSYKVADGIITSSQTNFEYVKENYNPSCIHLVISNYIETNVFKPENTSKKKGSICFVGRLSKEKNLFALLKALKGLPYILSIIGSGRQEELLNNFAIRIKVGVNFLGNIPNHKLPEILNRHELFILPSLWENMPKTLLEAMACAMPVIGTNVQGINEIIDRDRNGILCNTDSKSIRTTIINLMEDKAMKKRLGNNARKTIVENYSLDYLADKELELMEGLL